MVVTVLCAPSPLHGEASARSVGTKRKRWASGARESGEEEFPGVLPGYPARWYVTSLDKTFLSRRDINIY